MKTSFGIITLLLISILSYSQITIDTARSNLLSKNILTLLKSNELDSAKCLIQVYIAIHEKSKTHEDSIAWYTALTRTGDRLRKRRYLTNALPFYNQSLPLSYDVFGEKHLNTGKVYYNIGVCYANKGYFEKA